MTKPAEARRPDAAGEEDYRRILLNDIPLIDTRAPVEFAKGALPCSTSLPLMSDEERAQVGTCYKQQGQQAAIELGHRLVSGDIKKQRVQAWVDFTQQHPQGYLYCWRGGLRSQTCQQWLAEAGVHYPRIHGGYKALRQFLIREFERISHQHPLLIVSGRTGCNKTALIQALPQAVDLEALANHLGSSFGRHPAGQPTQLNFENALAVALLKAEQVAAEKNTAIVLEDESRLIGRCAIPPQLQAAMKSAPIVVMDVTLEERIEHTYHNYILEKQHQWKKQEGADAGFAAFASDLRESLARVRKRLGGARYQVASDLLEQALTQHQAQAEDYPALHRQWIGYLLQEYYDPMYDYQLNQRKELVVFRGDRKAVTDFIHQYHLADGQ